MTSEVIWSASIYTGLIEIMAPQAYFSLPLSPQVYRAIALLFAYYEGFGLTDIQYFTAVRIGCIIINSVLQTADT